MNNSNLKAEGELDEASNHEDFNLSNKNDYKYQTEISQMMFVFGDVVDPSPSVLQLVEDIVRTQVIEMVIQSKKLASRRSSRNLSPEDLLFLIRYDRAKVNRLRTYLSWKDVRKKAKDSEPGAGGGDAEVEVEDVAVENAAKMAPKQVKLPWELSSLYSEHLLPFHTASTSSLDQNNLDDLDVPDEDDIEAHEDSLARLRQADEATKGMTKEEYVHYSECRQASFTFKKAKKFREFINSSNYLEVKPNDDIIDVLGFLAFEVVRELSIGAVALKQEEEEEFKSPPNDKTSDAEEEDDDNEDADEEEGNDEEAGEGEDEGKEDEEENDDTIRTTGNDSRSDALTKEEAVAALDGNESLETAKGDGGDSSKLGPAISSSSSSPSNTKPNKRKAEESNASQKDSNKKSKSERRRDPSSSGTSPSKQQSQSNNPTTSPENPVSPSRVNRSNRISENGNGNGHGKKKSKKTKSSSKTKSTKGGGSGSEKGPFCSLFLPPENSDRPLLPSHVARAFARLQKSKSFLLSSSTVMARGGGLRRTKVFVM